MKRCTEHDVAFAKNIFTSMIDLFWALFGLFDLEKMSLGGKHAFTEYIGNNYYVYLLPTICVYPNT